MKRISSYEEKREHERGEVFITQRMGWVKAHRWEEYRKEMRKRNTWSECSKLDLSSKVLLTDLTDMF